jgi:hypothetical protein
MLRLADLLQRGLISNGINVAVIRPEPFFGLLARRCFLLNKWLRYLDKFVLFPFRLVAHARGSLLVHIVDHSNAVYCFWLNQKKSVVTCNDLLALRSARGEFREHKTRLLGKLLQRLILEGLHRATHLACISEATRIDALRLTGRSEESVSCIYLGIAPIFESGVAQGSLSEGPLPCRVSPVPVGIKKKYILHVEATPGTRTGPGYCSFIVRSGNALDVTVRIWSWSGHPSKREWMASTFSQLLPMPALRNCIGIPPCFFFLPSTKGLAGRWWKRTLAVAGRL